MRLADNLRARLAEVGMSQAELARQIGIAQPTIADLLSGKSQGSKHLHRIAKALGTTPEWLLGETDNPSPDAVHAPRLAWRGPEPEARSDVVELAEFDVSYGLGGAYIHDSPARQRLRTFSREWVRQFTDSPFDPLFWATGSGPSMMPAILDSDILLIDTAQQTPRMWDQFWAIDMHGMGMIKALRPGRDGSMRILSINPDFPEEVAYDGEMNVVGRVVAIVRKV